MIGGRRSLRSLWSPAPPLAPRGAGSPRASSRVGCGYATLRSPSTFLVVSRAGQQGVARFLHHGDAALADRVAEGVAREVVTDVIALGDADVLVDDRAAHARAAPDIDVVEDHRR